MKNFKNGVDFLNNIRVIFYALVGMPLLLFLFLHFSSREGSLTALIDLGDHALTYIVAIAVVCWVVAIGAYIWYQCEIKKLRGGRKLENASDCLPFSKYEKICIARSFVFGSISGFWIDG